VAWPPEAEPELGEWGQSVPPTITNTLVHCLLLLVSAEQHVANKLARIVWAVWSRQQPYGQVQSAA